MFLQGSWFIIRGVMINYIHLNTTLPITCVHTHTDRYNPTCTSQSTKMWLTGIPITLIGEADADTKEVAEVEGERVGDSRKSSFAHSNFLTALNEFIDHNTTELSLAPVAKRVPSIK